MRAGADRSTIATNGTRTHTNGSSLSPGSAKSHAYSTNGFGRTNGSSPESHTNGMAKGKGKQSSYFGHNREEVTRLLIQALGDLGYQDSSNSLIQESGYDLESPTVAALRHAVLNGEWAETEALLFGSHSSGARNSKIQQPFDGLPLAQGVEKEVLQFKIRRQKYLELLEQRDQGAALVSLQTELTPLHPDTAQLHLLSGLMVCPSTDELRRQAGWDGASGSSRATLLSEIAAYIAPSAMIPNARLAVLLDQVKQSQVSACDFHDPMATMSLFSDHMCDTSQFPLKCVKRIQESGEIYYLAFSPDGDWLATCGSTPVVTVYSTATFEERYRLEEHARSVPYLAWSPDSTKIVTCSTDHLAKVWDVHTERVLTTIINHSEPVTSAAWLPDGSAFITGALDSRSPINTWSASGDLMCKWPASHRSQDIAISPDGERLISISTNQTIFVYSITRRMEEFRMRVAAELTCVSISSDSRYILVNLNSGELQLIDIDARTPVRKYVGQKQGLFIIRSTFGGVDENLILSGSEDGKMYVFNRERGNIIDTLEDHAPLSVNAIAWHPGKDTMFASGGDDQSIRIWTKPHSRPASIRGNSDASARFRSGFLTAGLTL